MRAPKIHGRLGAGRIADRVKLRRWYGTREKACTQSKHPARAVRMKRSLKAFALGAPTGVRVTRAPVDRVTWSKDPTYLASRSRASQRDARRWSSRVAAMLRASWVAQSPGRVVRKPPTPPGLPRWPGPASRRTTRARKYFYADALLADKPAEAARSLAANTARHTSGPLSKFSPTLIALQGGQVGNWRPDTSHS